MCDGSGFDGGMMGGASFPMNTPGNTMGMGDVVPAGSKGQFGSGDLMYGGFGGYGFPKPKKKKKKSAVNTIAQKKPAYSPFGFGAGNGGSFDMSPRPLFVPRKPNK